MAITSEWGIEDVNTTSSSGNDTHSRAGWIEALYHNNFYDKSASSAEGVFAKEFNWDVLLAESFPRSLRYQNYENSFRNWLIAFSELISESPSTQVRELSEDFDFVTQSRRERDIAPQSTEPKLNLHESMEESMTVDWKRARELYRRMLEE